MLAAQSVEPLTSSTCVSRVFLAVAAVIQSWQPLSCLGVTELAQTEHILGTGRATSECASSGSRLCRHCIECGHRCLCESCVKTIFLPVCICVTYCLRALAGDAARSLPCAPSPLKMQQALCLACTHLERACPTPARWGTKLRSGRGGAKPRWVTCLLPDGVTNAHPSPECTVLVRTTVRDSYSATYPKPCSSQGAEREGQLLAGWARKP